MVKLLKGGGLVLVTTILVTTVLVAIFMAYFFLIDGIIKAQLEREGSRALQAPLEISNVTFHLLPTSLTLHDVRLGNARVPTHNLVQAETLSLPLSLRDLTAHKLLVDVIEIHGLRFNRPRAQQSEIAPTTNPASATRSPQLHEALQRVQQMLNHPLASNTIDPNASIAGALLVDGFKPLFDQIIAALNAVAAPSRNTSDWQVLIRRVDVDGALDFGAHLNNDSALHFTGTIENITPQPQLFDAVTQFDLHSNAGAVATLHASGSLDKRKLAQLALRFDLSSFPLAQWSLSDDPELKITIVSANVDIQALLSLTGNQVDLNALAHFRQAHVEVANGDNEIARVAADVWRRTDAFDINLQASGDLQNPVLKLNSSLDAPLATALRQIQSAQQPAAAFPQATPFSNSP